ncbi:MAG TPA: DUF4124 domain-containing protein [Gammaproteobacteria bacterium]
MNRSLRILLLAAVTFAAGAAFAQKLYRWIDENGVVHYGDRIPPEYADRDRAVLNSQGIAVDHQQGAVTEAERAAREREREAAETEAAAKAEIARRDRMLLETYLSVEDIEDLRDRRLELLESQITVTEIYLSDLRDRLAALKAEAGKYKPYSDREDAPQIPHELARDISQTESSIASYEAQLQRTRDEQATLRAQFDSDIQRFKELKGG